MVAEGVVEGVAVSDADSVVDSVADSDAVSVADSDAVSEAEAIAVDVSESVASVPKLPSMGLGMGSGEDTAGSVLALSEAVSDFEGLGVSDDDADSEGVLVALSLLLPPLSEALLVGVVLELSETEVEGVVDALMVAVPVLVLVLVPVLVAVLVLVGVRLLDPLGVALGEGEGVGDVVRGVRGASRGEQNTAGSSPSTDPV